MIAVYIRESPSDLLCEGSLPGVKVKLKTLCGNMRRAEVLALHIKAAHLCPPSALVKAPLSGSKKKTGQTC